MATTQTPFEMLGDRRFQLFAQSLVSYEFPDLQAFPVGQRDGGRDAVSGNSTKGDQFIVFQVKFVERPSYLKDVDKWLATILADEHDNIVRLAGRGASKYILLTNVPGSAHLDTGTIDRASESLVNALPLSAQVWWRNDLEIRLAKHRNLKWHYRELLSGQDVIDELVASGLSEHRDRRKDAIAASLSAQYEVDRAVRFKQVDLQNDLLELFVDVPLEPASRLIRRRLELSRRALGEPHRPMFVGSQRLVARDWSHDLIRAAPDNTARALGAADLLLALPARPGVTRFVIEGAPGQGKSTLAQYLCQVHRIHLLAKTHDLRRLPDAHQKAGRRLPFKVDLRELATFFRGEDPFASVTHWGGLPPTWPRSLEGFLAAQVTRYSGGAAFSVADLLAIARTGPILLVLDGLDEVAEIADRKMVVENVEQGLASLIAVANSMQVIVTSRPPAFANSPGFPEPTYSYMALASLPRDLILDYTNRWGRARRLPCDELAETSRILRVKLDEPHMRDLAQNPMQLAILLSLIYARGESLPDKRTQLYQGYVDLYFAREASKSRLVRKHRDLLYGLHGYLGWSLHVGAEQSAEKGSIALLDLKNTVTRYLIAHGESAALAEELFRGVVERIIALVATRQERFEFAVQPLREFFAAQHLHATAQTSEMGKVRPGTRADRFDALARDAFWLNVVRFYAGFYTSGELPSLVDRLEALAWDPAFTLTDHPRALAAMLLSDWAFSLDKRSRERAVSVAIDGLGTRHAMRAGRRTIVLPRKSGREEVVAKCLELVNGAELRAERKRAVRRVLGEHVDSREFYGTWLEHVTQSTGHERTDWLVFGGDFGFVEAVETETAERLIDGDEDPDVGRRCAKLLAHNWAQVVEESPTLTRLALRGIVAWPDEPIELSKTRMSMLIWLRAILAASPIGRTGALPSSLEGDRPVPDHLQTAARMLALIGKREKPRETWSELIEQLRLIEPESWSAMVLALRLGLATKRGRRPSASVELADETVPLLDRAVAARMRSGGSHGTWWVAQAEACETQFAGAFVAAGALLWTRQAAQSSIGSWLDRTVRSLSLDDYGRLMFVLTACADHAQKGKGALPGRQIRDLSQRLMLLHYATASSDEQSRIWEERLARYRGRDPKVVRQCTEIAFDRARDAASWKRALQFARRCLTCDDGEIDVSEGAMEHLFPKHVAATIVESAESYPLRMVEGAESLLEPRISPRSTVGAVARHDRWFAP